jgi:riboflavin kinase/FMN adenylyltransferase
LNIALDFFARLRGEQKFASVPELVAQIKLDVETTRTILSDHVMRSA